MDTNKTLGWIRDFPDFRDYNFNTPIVNEKVSKLSLRADQTPIGVDLRPYFSPIEDQGQIGSCTANAAIGIIEYYQKKTFGTHIDGSRLFTYKTTRNLMKVKGDTGAYLRDAMKSLALFGVCPEEYLSYNVAKYDEEPTAFHYSLAQNYQALTYYRLDPVGTLPATILSNARKSLASGLPFMFGFVVYKSIYSAKGGKIPFPTTNDPTVGGHAIVAVGYDDNMMIGNKKGAFIIRNSWGTSWGDSGYGYLPYEYFLTGLATDLWVMVTQEFINTNVFK